MKTIIINSQAHRANGTKLVGYRVERALRNDHATLKEKFKHPRRLRRWKQGVKP